MSYEDPPSSLESESEGSSLESERSFEDRSENLVNHERLEGLEQGAALLPLKLVWSLIRIQEKAEKWDRFKHED